MKFRCEYKGRYTRLIDTLVKTSNLTDEQLKELLSGNQYDDELFCEADKMRRKYYGDEVYLRGLIEFTNYCKNNCYYCGIRRDNCKAHRYRLTREQIIECCREGYELGYRTFVLQGGEDAYFTDDRMCEIVSEIRSRFKDCAITLSIGEKSYESYKRYFDAGANRYLLRHETANGEHYNKLHPEDMSCDNRKQCLYNLKEIGFQVGAGMMVGSPFQSINDIICDIRFLQELGPDMIGIGPYICHRDTPFCGKPNGSLELTLRLLAIIRLMFPYVLLPATTALGTIHPNGRELGLKAGANVVMPNLTTTKYRKHYEIYENKICTGEEAAECRDCLEARIASAGYRIVTDRGDVKRRL